MAENQLVVGSQFESYQIENILSKKNHPIELYKIKDLKENKDHLLKLDRMSSKKLKFELDILNQVKDNECFPSVTWHSFSDSLDFIIYNIYYPEINSVIASSNSLTLSQSTNIFLQLVKCLEVLHKKSIIHGNISSKTVLIDPVESIVWLTDFTESTDLKTCQLSKPKDKPKVSCSFSSLNVHIGEFSRKNDLESLGYLLIYMFTGKLPWKKFFPKNTFSKWQKVYIMKRSHGVDQLCTNCPKEFKSYFSYLKQLSNTDPVDYEYIKFLISSIPGCHSFNIKSPLETSPKKIRVKRAQTAKSKSLKVKNRKVNKAENQNNSDLSQIEDRKNREEVDPNKTLEDDRYPEFLNRDLIIKSRNNFIEEQNSKLQAHCNLF